MADVSELDSELNTMIREGKAMEGYEKFYAENVVMMENDQAFEGKDTNRQRELEFFGNVQEVHKFELAASAVSGDTSFCQQTIDVTFKDGNRMTMEQVAVRTWKDGQVVRERFFYKGL